MVKSKEKLYFQFFNSEIASKNNQKNLARILIIYNHDGIVVLSIATSNPYLDKQNDLLEDNQTRFDLIEKTEPRIEQAIKDYLNGSKGALNNLSINWDLISGTCFQKMIWHKIIKISFGYSKSYKQIAQEIKTKAYRAVGSACGANPIMLIIPCHRIISSSGKLAGFSSGLDLKKTLLDLEGIEYQQS